MLGCTEAMSYQSANAPDSGREKVRVEVSPLLPAAAEAKLPGRVEGAGIVASRADRRDDFDVRWMDAREAARLGDRRGRGRRRRL